MDIETSSGRWRRWRVAIAAFIAQGLGPGLFAAYGLFVAPLSEAFDASHASLAFGMSLLLILQAAIGPGLGSLLDRYSTRAIMLFGSSVATAGLIATSQATNLWMLLGSYLIAVTGFTFYAPLPAVLLVTNHYGALRGRALALAATGTSVAGMFLPLATAQLLDRYDWRGSLLCIAMLVGGLTFTTFLRCIPKSSGAPRPVQASASQNTATVAGSWGFMRTRAFWIIGLTFSILFGLAGFYAFSMAPHVSEVGLEVEDAALVMATGATVSLFAKLGFASIVDRLESHLIPLTVSLIVIQACAWFLISTSQTLALFLVAASLFSFTIGPFLALGPYLNSLYFDEQIIGRVNGAQAPLALPFALSAPPLAGLSYDVTGSYVSAFYGAIALLLVLGTLFLFLGRPQRLAAPILEDARGHDDA